MSRDIRREEWKNTDPAETMKMFCNLNENDLVTDIEEVVNLYNSYVRPRRLNSYAHNP